jgi:hypothetical protein
MRAYKLFNAPDFIIHLFQTCPEGLSLFLFALSAKRNKNIGTLRTLRLKRGHAGAGQAGGKLLNC